MAYHGLGSIAEFDSMTIEERDWNLYKLKDVKEEEKKQQEEANRKAKSSSRTPTPRRF